MFQAPVVALENPIIIGVLFTAMSVVPFGLLSLTSYLKISVVLSILRNALGAGQIPGPAVVSLLSMVLTFYVMAPVGANILSRVENNGLLNYLILKSGGDGGSDKASLVSSKKKAVKNFSSEAIADISKKLEFAFDPLREFLKRHAGTKEVAFFTTQAVKNLEASEKITASSELSRSFLTLVPAFVLSQLTEAFAIGFSIFLPFLVIDLVVSNVLIAMGMSMVNPVTVTVPLKLLLFVMCDGWFVLSRALILQYGG